MENQENYVNRLSTPTEISFKMMNIINKILFTSYILLSFLFLLMLSVPLFVVLMTCIVSCKLWDAANSLFNRDYDSEQFCTIEYIAFYLLSMEINWASSIHSMMCGMKGIENRIESDIKTII